MKNCTNCGAPLNDDATFCTACGKAVGAPGAAPVPNPQAYQQPVAPDPYDHTAEFSAEDISHNKVYALLPYLLGVLGIIVVGVCAKDSPYAMFHARQGAGLTAIYMFVLLFNIIPFLGWLAAGVCGGICFVLSIIAFAGVCGGKAKEVPIIRSFGFMR